MINDLHLHIQALKADGHYNKLLCIGVSHVVYKVEKTNERFIFNEVYDKDPLINFYTAVNSIFEDSLFFMYSIHDDLIITRGLITSKVRKIINVLYTLKLDGVSFSVLKGIFTCTIRMSGVVGDFITTKSMIISKDDVIMVSCQEHYELGGFKCDSKTYSLSSIIVEDGLFKIGSYMFGKDDKYENVFKTV